VSPTRSERPGRYHHGDLKAALVEVAVDLIAERGVRGFSLAEASRRLGVTVAAPYRHFADREELLAAVAVRAFGTLGAALEAAAPSANPEARLAALAAAYVRFAADHRPLFDVLFGAGLDKDRFPGVRQAAAPLAAVFAACVREICGDDAQAAAALAGAVAATAHGHATLLLDGALGDTTGEAAAERAAQATLALIAGRPALARPAGDGHEVSLAVNPVAAGRPHASGSDSGSA
jgi:AcrR family transcriptional regulator